MAIKRVIGSIWKKRHVYRTRQRNKNIRKHIGNYRYAFSVVLTVYNLEKYIEEALESIISQSFDFRKYIQIIIVNDGSTDGSEDICKLYCRKYPKNIMYIYQENSGVSSARNIGLKYVKGKYVTFFDGDDKWTQSSFENVWYFFEKNYSTIDMVACRRKWFEGIDKYVGNDFRFKDKGERIIDIVDEPWSFHLDVTSTFIKAELAGSNRFRENLIVGEDCRYINEILLKKCRYGALPSAQLNMRKRIDGSSLTQSVSYSDKAALSVYTDTLHDYYEYFYEYSEYIFGNKIPYVQYLIMDAVRYRTAVPMPDSLEETIANEYVNRIKALIEQTDINVLLTLRRGNVSEKANLLKLKDPDGFFDKLQIKGRDVLYDGQQFGRLGIRKALMLDKFDVSDEETIIKGSILLPGFFLKPELLVCDEKTGDEYIVSDIVRNPDKSHENMLKEYYKLGYDFKVKIPTIIRRDDMKIYLLTDTEAVSLYINETTT